VSSRFLASALNDIEPKARLHGNQPFGAVCAITSPRCHLLQETLARILSCQDDVEPSIVEGLLSCLVQEALDALHQPVENGCLRPQGENEAGNTDRVAIVRLYIMIHWAERVTLAQLADIADCSIWHLASIFRSRVGLPIHRYMKRLRLRHALERLHRGCTDLTRLALDCGFSSHSHFTAAFRQEFGTTPRNWQMTELTSI
jgi:AraC-like DNA-binding protein